MAALVFLTIRVAKVHWIDSQTRPRAACRFWQY